MSTPGGRLADLQVAAAELAVHPVEGAGSHQLYLMCDDVNATIEQLAAKGVTCGPVNDLRWELVTSVRLLGGGELGLYEPRHPKATEL